MLSDRHSIGIPSVCLTQLISRAIGRDILDRNGAASAHSIQKGEIPFPCFFLRPVTSLPFPSPWSRISIRTTLRLTITILYSISSFRSKTSVFIICTYTYIDVGERAMHTLYGTCAASSKFPFDTVVLIYPSRACTSAASFLIFSSSWRQSCSSFFHKRLAS